MNSITNNTASIIGRENLTKLSNSINKTFLKSKYRDYLKPGNTVQLISKVSHMSLQICASVNDSSRLVLNGAGQIGQEAFNSHFFIETDPKHGHLKFRNQLNYVAFDQDYPCVLAEPTTKPKHKSEYIRARNEFRMHEVIGSDEYFALESVYFPGKYLSILPDGSITVSKNKADESTHFCLNVLSVHSANGAIVIPSSSSSSIVTSPSFSASANATSNSSNAKQEESNAAAAQASTSNNNTPIENNNDQVPPAYSSLYPKLPPQ
jgi:hypothetical protein